MNREDILRRLEEIRLLRNWDLPNDLGLPDPDYAGGEYDALTRRLQTIDVDTNALLNVVRQLAFEVSSERGKRNKASKLVEAIEKLDRVLCLEGNIPSDWMYGRDMEW